jgi:hypothetical protein
LDNCYFKEETPIQRAGLENYKELAWILLSTLPFGCLILHLVLFYYGKYKDHTHSYNSQSSQEDIDRDQQYALDSIGRDTVYRLFLSKSWFGWSIAFLMVYVQLWMCYIFVEGSEFKFDTSTDMKYTWM